MGSLSNVLWAHPGVSSKWNMPGWNTEYFFFQIFRHSDRAEQYSHSFRRDPNQSIHFPLPPTIIWEHNTICLLAIKNLRVRGADHYPGHFTLGCACPRSWPKETNRTTESSRARLFNQISFTPQLKLEILEQLWWTLTRTKNQMWCCDQSTDTAVASMQIPLKGYPYSCSKANKIPWGTWL